MVKKLRKDSIMLKNNRTGNLESLAPAAAKSLHLCLTLCDPIEGSPPEQMIKKNNIVTKCKSKDKIKSLLFPGGAPGPGQPATLETRASHLGGHSAAPGGQGRAAGLPSGASCLWGGEGFCKSCYK